MTSSQSVTRTKSHDIKPFPSGKSAFRFLVGRKRALCDPLVGDIASREGEFSTRYGKDRYISTRSQSYTK